MTPGQPDSARRRPRSAHAALALGLLLGLGHLAACRREPVPAGAGRGVLLIAVDALRADHLSGRGYDRETTPTLDGLAGEGASFTNNYTTAPWNLPAAASLLTGCDPYVSRRSLPAGLPRTLATRWNVPERAPRLAEQFLLAGWTTAAFVDHPNLASVYGFGSGFQDYSSTADLEESAGAELGLEGLTGQLVQWLRAREHDEDWFAFVHLHDLERIWQASDPRWDTAFTPRPELAYVPPVGDAEHLFHAIPRERWSGGMSTLGEYESRYDGALLRLDGQLKRLFDLMAQTGWLDDTTICVVGTHGLGFGEAGLLLDHGTFDDVDLAVPWILRPAREPGIAPGQRVAALSSLLDVAPTLLDLAGLSAPAAMHGVSFAPYLAGQGAAPRDHLLARSAFQDGYAVIDPQWTLELTQPWRVEDEILATSWYGHAAPFPLEQRVELRAHAGGDGPAAELTAEQREERIGYLCTLGRRWLRDVEGLRGSLQTVDWLTRAGFEPEADVFELGPCASGAGALR